MKMKPTKYRGIARAYVEIEYEIECTDEQFDNGEWYELAEHAVDSEINSELASYLDGIDIEADDLEVVG